MEQLLRGSGQTPRYNGRMNRIFDKFLVLVCCLPMLAVEQVNTALVASLLLVIGITAVNEACYPTTSEQVRRQTGRVLPIIAAALSTGYLIGACFVPVAVCFAALAVYDLVYRRTSAPCALVVVVALYLAARGGMAAVEVAGAVCATVLAAALAYRTEQLQTQHMDNVRERDALREQSLSLEQRNRDLIDRQEYEARLATLTERSRLAREIHDNVGHLLTRAIMQVEAFKVVHAEQPQVEHEFDAVATTLHEALDTMRQSVHGMADDACDLSVQVRRVVDETCRDTPLTATCDISASTANHQVTACLTAVVREALSNTLRHADAATHVRVELVEHPGFWRMTITDNGRPPTAAHGEASGGLVGGQAGGTGGTDGASGFGLMSMEQRVRGLGGTMSASYSERAHGFVVYVSIPRRETAA